LNITGRPSKSHIYIWLLGLKTLLMTCCDGQIALGEYFIVMGVNILGSTIAALHSQQKTLLRPAP